MSPRRTPVSTVEPVPWGQFVTDFRWSPGEHVAIVGTTGCGKTTLARYLLPLRRNVAIIATKPSSASLDEFLKEGFVRYKMWPDNLPAAKSRRRLIWPPLTDIDYTDYQEWSIGNALGSIFKEEAWTVYIDEARWVSESLHQKSRIVTLLKQGRELHISMVIGDQRPVFLPRETWSQSTHLFFWRTNDERDMMNIGSIGGLDSRTVADEVASLGKHEFLYINSRNRVMARSQTPDPGRR